MTWLISSDLHLSDRPRDDYRFGLFPWLREQQRNHKVTATFLLGDLTQDKDKHSAALVNRTIEELLKLKPPVYILRGNHDGISPDNPFFKFLSCIDGINFVVTPQFHSHLGVAFVPHCQNQAELDQGCGMMPPRPRAVLLHNLFDGALSETGTRLNGLRASPIEILRPGRAWAGDVHKPQQCGPVTYVGAPYHVRFNDNYNPRVILVKNGLELDLHYPAPRKWSLKVRDADEIERSRKLKRGDQVKIIIELAREEVLEGNEHKQRVLAACKNRGLDVYGIELAIKSSTVRAQPKQAQQGRATTDVFNDFCLAENLASSIKQAGVELLK